MAMPEQKSGRGYSGKYIAEIKKELRQVKSADE